MLRLSLAVMVTTLVIGIGSALVGAGALLVASEGALGVFLFGVVLWWFGERDWDDIGRAIMVTVLLAVVVGVPQYLIDQGQKERDAKRASDEKQRDFTLSLTLQQDLSGADLKQQDLKGVRLEGKSLRDANLRGATLTETTLRGTDLRRADLSGADLQNADLRSADLRDAVLEGANLKGADLSAAQLRGVSMPAANLQGANLETTELQYGCLARADLRGASLAGSDLSGAVLTEADLRGATLERDLRPARLEDAGLAGVRHDENTTWPLDFKRASVSKAVRGTPRSPRQTAPHTPEALGAKVIRVVDGDTLQMQADPGSRASLPSPGRTRLIGLNAPDLGRPGGKQAQKLVARELEGKHVEVELGTNPERRRDRYLVTIWRTPTKTFNQDLLESGLVISSFRDRKDNQQFQPAFEAAELRARERGNGVWRRCPKSDFSG
jgi:uncharacterized protein YjbI with pentapeptide repeats